MVDQKDIRILKELKNNSRLSARGISEKTRIPITTVFNRIKRMEKSGVIRGYTAVLDEDKLGKHIAAYIMITVDYNFLKRTKVSQHELAMKLKQHEFVDEAAIITGIGDIILKIRATDLSELNKLVTENLRNIDGVEKTQTSVILDSC